MTQPQGWGKPTAKSFRKTYLRRVSAGESNVIVHVEVFDIVCRILNTAVANGVELPRHLGGFTTLVPGVEAGPEHFGLAIRYVEGMDYEDWGFVLRDGKLEFTGDLEKARELSELAESMRVIEAMGEEPVHPERLWQHTPPGRRDLSQGDCGDDVLFIQVLMGAADVDGVFGPSTESVVNLNLRRWGLPVDGVVGGKAWRRILPRTSRFSLSRGDSGLSVRVLQSALVAYDWNEDLVVTGRFDKPTDVAVRELQENCGLRVSGRVRAPEWAVLLGSSPCQQD